VRTRATTSETRRATTHRVAVRAPSTAWLGIHVLLHAQVLRMRVHCVVLFLKLLLEQMLELLIMLVLARRVVITGAHPTTTAKARRAVS
jgi:hypothetical protein